MKRVKLFCLALIGLFFAACHSNDDTWGDWEKSTEFGGDNRTQAVCFTAANGDVYVGMGINNNLNAADQNLKDFWKFKNNTWSRVKSSKDNSISNFPDPIGGRTGSVAFVVGKYAYVGAGWRRAYAGNNRDTYFSNFYVFDTENDEWVMENGQYVTIDIRDSGEDAKDCSFFGGIAFEMGGKGYVGTGQADGRVLQKIFCYDPATKAWSDAGFQGDSRCGAVCFKTYNQIVVCLGSATSSTSSKKITDVWAFDGSTWHRKAPLEDRDGDWNNDYGNIPRSYAVAFTSNLDKGVERAYIVGGTGSNTCWEYHLGEDRWDEVTKFSANMGSVRVAAVGFNVGQYGYITTGGTGLDAANDNSTWKFIPGVEEDDNND